MEMSDYLQRKLNYSVNSKNGAFDIYSATEAWLEKTVKTDSPRRRDICNDKRKSVLDFFEWLGKSPETTQSEDVQKWLFELKRKKLAAATICYRMSALSNFFEFLHTDEEGAFCNLANPVKAHVPKQPNTSQSKGVNALSEQELTDLLTVVENYALSGDLLYLRDYAILQIFVVTGWSRQEVLGLIGENVKITKQDIVLINPRVKSHYFSNFKLKDKAARTALLAYLKATSRDKSICGTAMPLWLPHDKGAKKLHNRMLSSHSFARRMKFYATRAGIKDFHLHKLRRTYTTAITGEYPPLNDTSKTPGQDGLCDTKPNIERVRIVELKYSNLLREIAFGNDKKRP